MGKRQESRDRIERRLVELGRRHLVTEGAAGLSLRAIAREMGMVSSAVYRYVSSRDDLLTLLLIHEYTDLADTVEDARAGAGGTWRDELGAIARSARQWAVARPASWALLYGSPVPGYHAPPDKTVVPGTRVVAAIFAVVTSAIRTGDIPPSTGSAPPSLSGDLDALRAEFAFDGDDGVVTRCLVVWAALVGAISLEVFGQYGADTFGDPAAVFDVQLALLTELLTRN